MALFGELKAQRYGPAGLGAVPVLMADADAYKTNYNNGGEGEVFGNFGHTTS